MSQKETKKKLIGPWRSVHAAIWLIGIAFLATRNWWWPGILVLLAISGIFEAFLQHYAPEAYVEEKLADSPSPVGSAPTTNAPVVENNSAPAAIPMPDHRLELLPHVCPNCNAPIRGHEVKWTGLQSADCPYCGSNLPMKTPAI